MFRVDLRILRVVNDQGRSVHGLEQAPNIDRQVHVRHGFERPRTRGDSLISRVPVVKHGIGRATGKEDVHVLTGTPTLDEVVDGGTDRLSAESMWIIVRP